MTESSEVALARVRAGRNPQYPSDCRLPPRRARSRSHAPRWLHRRTFPSRTRHREVPTRNAAQKGLPVALSAVTRALAHGAPGGPRSTESVRSRLPRDDRDSNVSAFGSIGVRPVEGGVHGIIRNKRLGPGHVGNPDAKAGVACLDIDSCSPAVERAADAASRQQLEPEDASGDHRRSGRGEAPDRTTSSRPNALVAAPGGFRSINGSTQRQ